MDKLAVLVVLLLVSFGTLAEACESNQMKQGYRIWKAQCTSGYGCSSEFRYESLSACKTALEGRKQDICTIQKPCRHSGLCVQISQEPGFHCQCGSTGYYGTHCEKRCPHLSNLRSADASLHACISI